MTSQAKAISFEQYIQLALSHAEYQRNPDDTWTASAPSLPGCVTWGLGRSEAVEMIRDAIEAWVLTAIQFGDPVPEIDGCVLHYAVNRVAESSS